jgi:hypothetical protein
MTNIPMQHGSNSDLIEPRDLMKEVARVYRASLPSDNATSRTSELMRLADSLEIGETVYPRSGVDRVRLQESADHSGSQFLVPPKSADLWEEILHGEARKRKATHWMAYYEAAVIFSPQSVKYLK